nr:50S ribosomal protein L32 [Scytosiphon promiscuus]QDM58394.1 50S ribosomal protein L32 [Scytosiphon promiscuus]QDM58537.1 50S ribosomal protein L32 [Scytosiphon promiscuus]QTW91552.1 ribosomal protein L32 [Scytosiphon lomentaria]WAM64632.1 50S ribosomal protein L32 [Scytosiphon lomentaria]
MAVPKSRRSKAKGKTRLSIWKKKGEKASRLALNSAKTFFQKEKKDAALALMKEKSNGKEITGSVE